MLSLASQIRRISIAALFLIIVPWCIVLAMCIRVGMLPDSTPFDIRDLREIQRISLALEQHRAKFGEYPPDFSTDDPAREIRDHLKNAFPLREHTLDVPADVEKLNPRNALHFWLRGCYMNNLKYPVTGKYDDELEPMTREQIFAEIESLDSVKIMRETGEDLEASKQYFELVQSYTQMATSQQGDLLLVRERFPLYVFENRRLSLNNEFAPMSSLTPLVYFRNDRYSDKSAETTEKWDAAFPYHSPQSTRDKPKYEAATTFQIINAGRDGLYGGSSIRACMAYLDDAHCDNLTNFSAVPLGQELRLRQRASAIRLRNVSPFYAIFSSLLLYPMSVAVRRKEDGVSVLARSLRTQWVNSPPSPYWKNILKRQRGRRRTSAIDRMKVAHSRRDTESRSNPNRSPRTLSRNPPTKDSSQR